MNQPQAPGPAPGSQPDGWHDEHDHHDPDRVHFWVRHRVLVLVICAGIILAGFVGNSLFMPSNPEYGLSSAYGQLQLPASVVQKSATYDPGSPLDRPRSWLYTYGAGGSRIGIYLALQQAIQAGGYHIDAEGSNDTNINAAAGYFTARNPSNGVFLTVEIMPQPSGSLNSVDVSAPATGVDITVENY